MRFSLPTLKKLSSFVEKASGITASISKGLIVGGVGLSFASLLFPNLSLLSLPPLALQYIASLFVSGGMAGVAGSFITGSMAWYVGDQVGFMQRLVSETTTAINTEVNNVVSRTDQTNPYPDMVELREALHKIKNSSCWSLKHFPTCSYAISNEGAEAAKELSENLKAVIDGRVPRIIAHHYVNNQNGIVKQRLQSEISAPFVQTILDSVSISACCCNVKLKD